MIAGSYVSSTMLSQSVRGLADGSVRYRAVADLGRWLPLLRKFLQTARNGTTILTLVGYIVDSSLKEDMTSCKVILTE